MAGNTVNIDLNIRSNNTLRDHVQDSGQFADNLARANREGAKAASMQYGRARGVAGVTGASARNFANEQQGLGGLVQLYAKIAANTYAAAAAFNVLKGALDTTTMVEGLNQLGARSGQALGTLSQNLVKATGGAISLREAMQATAQGTSAGLSTGQMLKLADTAKKASQVLGLDMSDALSRLSRGITKLEPELLDELGIFTKIGPATEAYARSIGKTTSSLTDFERRQAFANAVLKEGQEKFGSIDIPVNPYEQLLASLKNIAQSFLEIVNKVFTPFASLLANNSTLLTAAVIGIGIKISKSLFPILGTWRQELIETADVAKKKAAEIAGAYGENFVERVNRSRQVEPLKQQLAQTQTQSTAAMQAYLASTNNKSQFTKNLRTGGEFDAETAQKRLSSLEKEKKVLDEMTGPLTTQQQKKQQIYDAEIKSLSNVIKLKAEELAIQKQLTGALEDAQHIADLGNRSADARDKIMKQTAARSERLNLLSKVAQDTEQLGFKAATEKLKLGLDESKNMSKFSKFTTGILGTAAAGATELAILAESFNPVILGAEAAVGVFIALDAIFGENSKEAAAFTAAIDAAKESVNNATRTVANLNKEGALFPQTIQGLMAISNSFNELASSLENVAETAKKSKEKMSWWDKYVIDWPSKIVSKDVDSQLAKSLAEQVRGGIEILNKTQGGKEKVDLLKNLIKADSSTVEDLTKALKKLGEDAGPKVNKFFKEVGLELGNSSARLQNFKNTSEAVTKSYQEFIQSTASNDPLFKLAANIQANAVAMAQLKTDGIDEVTAAMIDLAKSPEKGLFFGEKFITNLLAVREEFVQQATAITGTEDALRYLDDQIDSTTAKYNAAKAKREGMFAFQTGAYDATLEKNKQEELLKGLKASRAEVQKALDLLPKDKIEAAKKIFVEGLEGAFETGSKYINEALGLAAEKAAITIGRAKLGAFSGEERAKQEMKLNLQELGIQERLIMSNKELLNSQYKLTSSIDLSNAQKALEMAKAEKKPQSVIDNLESALRVATAVSQEAGKKGGPNLKDLSNNTVKGMQIIDYASGGLEDVTLNKDEIARRNLALLGQAQANAAQDAQLETVKGQAAAAKIQGQMAIRAGKYLEDNQKLLAIEQAINQTQLTRLNIVNGNLDTATKSSILAQTNLENSAQELKNGNELTEINVRIANARQYATKEELQKLQFQKLGIEQRQSEENATLRMNQQIREINLKYHEQNVLRQEAFKTTQAQNALEQQRLTSQQGLLGVLQQAGALTGEFYAQETSRLAIQQARLEKTNAELQAQESLADTLNKVNQQQEIAAAAMTDAGNKLIDISKQIKSTFEEIANLVRDMVTGAKPGTTAAANNQTISAGSAIYAQITGGYQSGYNAPSAISGENTTSQGAMAGLTASQKAQTIGAKERAALAIANAQEKLRATEIQQRISERVEIVKAEQQQIALNFSYLVRTRDVQKQLNDLTLEGADYLSKSEIQRKQSYETEQFIFKQQQETTALTDKRAIAQTAYNALVEETTYSVTTEQIKTLDNLRQRLKLYDDEIKALSDIQNGERGILTIQQEREKLKNRFILENIQIEKRNTLIGIQLDTEKQSLDTGRQVYDASLARKNLIDDEVIQLEKQRKLQDADITYKNAVIQINKDVAAEEKKAFDNFVLANAGREDIDIGSGERLDAELKRVKEIGNARLNSANKAKDSTKVIAEAQGQYSARTLAYNDIVKSSFDRLGDAIATYVETGKWNFKSLINSMLADLLRWELKQQTSSLYKGISSFLNPYGANADIANSALASTAQSGYAINAYMGPAAKGKAFNQGYEVHKFAMGGAFTNQIVDTPTLFKFAKGTGLMGEAGPEAIMPLKRDSNGSLGVQSQPSNVNVVVNNHSGQPAQTNETIDSRGNRTIEVIVGDVVAQQIATKGSPVQQSMSNTYGSRPALARR